MTTTRDDVDLCAIRLAMTMKEAGLGGAALAKIVSADGGQPVSRQAIDKLSKGRTKISPAWAKRLGAALGVSSAYLTGLDDSPSAQPKVGARSVEEPQPRSEAGDTAKRPHGVGIVLLELDVRAAAGAGSELPEMEEIAGQSAHRVLARWQMPSDFLSANASDPSAVMIIRVAGDSMEPDYAANERVLVDTSHRHPSPGGIYVLWDGFGLILKRVELVYGSNPPTVRISSSNPAYPPIERLVDDVIINGRVIGKWVWK